MLTGYSQALLDIDYPSGTISARYDYGDDLFAQIDDPKSAAPTAHYFLYDGLGSTRSLTNNQGAIEQSYSYKPFGEANGFDPGAENQLTRNLFTGEQFDSETGYYHLRARQYDPSIGRFTSFDPAEDFQNRLHRYNYCRNNPTNYTDLNGRMTALQTIGMVSLYAGLMTMRLVGSIAVAWYIISLLRGFTKIRDNQFGNYTEAEIAQHTKPVSFIHAKLKAGLRQGLDGSYIDYGPLKNWLNENVQLVDRVMGLQPDEVLAIRLTDGTMVGWDKFLHFHSGAYWQKEFLSGGGAANMGYEILATRWHFWDWSAEHEYGGHLTNGPLGDFNKPFVPADVFAGVAGDRFQKAIESGELDPGGDFDVTDYFMYRGSVNYIAD